MFEDYFLNPFSWLFSFLGFVGWLLFFAVNTGSSQHISTLNTRNYEINTKLKDKTIEYDALVQQYEDLACSTRKLVRTTVRGITLCMNPETKALHKIDETND